MGLTIYDTTLRDGSQAEGIAFTVEDKLKITERLDRLGVDYIEGGWPGSNPKDEEYFARVQELELKNSEVVAFSSTRRPGIKAKDDDNINKMVNSGVKTVTIFAKSWDFHVTEALEISLEENLAMIRDTVSYLKENNLKVIFDGEHFFDGYKNNSQYALQTLREAEKAGADLHVLCDTNGGALTEEIGDIFKTVKEKVAIPVGIHTHNDGGLALANTLEAYEQGEVAQIQGTIGGLGERCGNADLCHVLPSLILKYKEQSLTKIDLKKLTPTYLFIMETANLMPNNRKPYVGKSAFTHKGGIHVSALQKNPVTYEHIEPQKVGNKRRVLVSELSGKSNFRYKLKELGFDLNKFSKKKLAHLSSTIKELEHKGYQFEGAEASLKLLIYREYYDYRPFFIVHDFKVITHNSGTATSSEAVIKVDFDGQNVHTAADGEGPVNALDAALRKALNGFSPVIEDMKLIDYKVRVLDGDKGTSAKVRVLIETFNKKQEETWTTVGVSTNILQASWQALVESIEYGLLMEKMEN